MHGCVSVCGCGRGEGRGGRERVGHLCGTIGNEPNNPKSA